MYPQVSFDRAGVSELFGLHILYNINEIVHINYHVMYRDDGLMIAPFNKKTNNIYKSAFQTIQKPRL